MTTILESISTLRKAQDLDRELYLAAQALEHDIPEEQSRIKSDLEKERIHLKSLEDNLKTIQMKQKQKEGLLADKEANIRKMEGQLSQVKTNKEYSTLKDEMASLKADNSLLEEEILKLFDEVSSSEKLVHTEKDRLKEIEKQFAEREAVLSQKKKDLESSLNAIKTQRDEILKQVPPEVRDRYILIIGKKQGLALVKIKGENCGACHYQLRAQIINEVRIGAALVMCENCARILYCE